MVRPYEPRNLFEFTEIRTILDSSPKNAVFASALVASKLGNVIIMNQFRSSFLDYVSFVIQKNSEFKDLFNHVILNMRESGVIDQVKKIVTVDEDQMSKKS